MTMRLCHSCPVTAQIERGEFADVAWGDTPCAKCVNAKAQAVDSLEQGHGRILPYNDLMGGGFTQGILGGMFSRRRDYGEDMADAVELLRGFCLGVAGLTPLQRKVLELTLDGLTLSQIAKKLGKTKQVVNVLNRRIRKRCFSGVRRNDVKEEDDEQG